MSPERTNDKPILLPVAPARRAIGLGNTKFWGLLASGEIESVKIGRKRLVVWSSLKNYVERLRGEAA
jgi:hypothetical protein